MATKDSGPISIARVEKEVWRCFVVGTTPFICNRMSEKAHRELLLPAGKKGAAEKAASAKHTPLQEFSASPYRLISPAAPTLLAHMASAFKQAMATAALDIPGTKKAQVGRLVYVTGVEGNLVALYGIPRLFMAITRSADMNRTPDVRTRAIIPRWACELEISFVMPIIKLEGVANLLSAAGITSGVGDWRPEKGAGDFGQFRIANEDDSELQKIIQEGGRAAQEAAMAEPEAHDQETRDLLDWYSVEAKRRGFSTAAANGRAN